MMDDPACTGGKLICRGRRGTEDSRPHVVATLESFTAIRFSTPERLHVAPASCVASTRFER